ncbi:uncharacterized protein LAESUDRAFT_643347 [Laetiporus sulphureus 93-53]|uniref:Uncharacterized protein n=1 Tax=Laetiporus sulphureus 93-53 TaxID=1314785 RepID=A0A165GWC5_9APHY|nr:uncharacterized protein LAESUDRAFT_643347 [Laetiporus sulphureus 93-53]KZT10915.1 hypothetical protein LAESUDRAFT_643347 [Laetiporus sulphureus 93-53]
MAPDSPRSSPATTMDYATRPNDHLTPGQAISEAWKRESPESQAQWRLADARARQQYLAPPRWIQSPGKKANGAKM